MTTRKRTKVAQDPRVVGGIYYCGYWGTTYRVDAITVNPRGLLDSITVTTIAADTPEMADTVGRTRTHCTSWDHRRDRVVSVLGVSG